jgi:hypothetical protein
VAEIHAILANGGVAKGRRFLTEAGCRKALEPQIEGRDLILDMPIRFGLGFALGAGMFPTPTPSTGVATAAPSPSSTWTPVPRSPMP